MLRDYNIDWMRKRKYWTPWEFNGLTSVIGSDAGMIPRATGTGTAEPAVLTGLGPTGLFMQAGNIIHGLLRVPFDVDPAFELGFRVNWASDSVTALDDMTWIMLLDFKAEDIAIANATTALDTIIPSDTQGIATARINKWTGRGIKNKNFLTRAQIENGAVMVFNLESDVVDMTNTWLLGLEMDYVPTKTLGQGNEINRSLTRTMG